MLIKLLILVHVLGASVWIGGHIVLLGVVLPQAMRHRDAARIIEFEKDYGRLGMLALGAQVITGLFLAARWLGGWQAVRELSPTALLVMLKVVLLLTIAGFAHHATRRVLPGLSAETLDRFAFHARLVTALSILLAVCGVAIRTGGLWA